MVRMPKRHEEGIEVASSIPVIHEDGRIVLLLQLPFLAMLLCKPFWSFDGIVINE